MLNKILITSCFLPLIIQFQTCIKTIEDKFEPVEVYNFTPVTKNGLIHSFHSELVCAVNSCKPERTSNIKQHFINSSFCLKPLNVKSSPNTSIQKDAETFSKKIKFYLGFQTNEIELPVFSMKKIQDYIEKNNGLTPNAEQIYMQYSKLPPIFTSWYIYIFYVVFLAGAYFIYRNREQRIIAQTRKSLLLRQQQKMVKLAEKFKKERFFLEQQQLEKDKLTLEKLVKDKTIELAIKAKDDDDKNRLLLSVKEKLAEAKKNPSQATTKIKESIRLLDDYLCLEDNTFEIQMDELHQAFFKNLLKSHPVLTIFDLRLCAYLKTGLNTQEIAEILYVLPSSLYVKRSRLRKKLELGADDDLYKFLSKF